jgi:hypothetical protein
MNNQIIPLEPEAIKARIFQLRDQQVMLDSDLAEIYGIETKLFNRAVNRNSNRFPESFRFQLTKAEFENLRCQFGTSSQASQNAIPEQGTSQVPAAPSGGHGGRRHLPYAFTEQGVAMLSAVLRSDTAIAISIQIMQAFVGMRRFLIAHGGLIQRMDSIEKRQATQEIKTDERFETVFNALEHRSCTPSQGIFFDGQIFDAYRFANDLLRQAKKSIVLIDNYVDDTVLEQLAKRRKNVRAVILTRKISKAFAQDLEKHNAQYPPVTVREFDRSHDRFLILDGETVYHLGASLKDLGKKWFAFSKLDKAALALMGRVQTVLKEELSA